ncbi:MAG: hypothetical protein AB7I30_15395 [Isosphaeraceae bacterium]
MNRRELRRRVGLAAGIVALAAFPPAENARAQFGVGFGGGFGVFTPNFNYVPSSTNFLYDRSNASIGAATATRNNVGHAARDLRASPNAYFNRVREFSGSSTYDLGTHQSLSSRAALTPYAPIRPPSRTPDQPASATPPAREVARLDSFFTAAGRLDWPRDAPNHAEVASERAEADDALATVFAQIKAQGKAKSGAVGLAKAKLIVYGQKALGQIRAERAAPVADVFHYYLLFLNQSLDQAGS